MTRLRSPPAPLLFLAFLQSLFTAITAAAGGGCNRTCGSATVPYPFGFSPGCTIPLSCVDAAKIQIGEFSVRNISAEHLLVAIPPSCNRSIDSLRSFSGPNIALTRTNGLFLRGCSNPGTAASCSVSTETISNRLNLSSCEPKHDNVSCYSNATGGAFLSTDEVGSMGCSYLFTSATYEASTENFTALVFSALELGWWVDGEDCRCSENANCTRVVSPFSGRGGFRCRCREGYEGDGFATSGAGGVGCSTVFTCGSSGKCGKSNKVGILVGGIIAGGSIMAGVACILFIIQRRCTSSKTCRNTKRLLSEASFNVPFYPYKTIERATENFSDTHRLGNGAYATVYVGSLSNGDLVAVKKIKHPEPDTIEQVMNEVKMISSVNHPNLVRLLGCCIERGEQILVYEFMPNGTLAQHLLRQRGPGLPWTVRLAIATATAKAIAYLHSAVDPPIYHRDIKSSNILLDQQFNAKMADFGLSRAVVAELSHVSTAPQGTPGYVDPQYHQNYHLSDKSDVYSFGVVLMEIITGMKVVDFNRAQTEVNLAVMAVDRIAKGRVEEIVDPFLGAQSSGWAIESIHKVAELAFRCLAFHRDMRPSMMEVADELELIRGSCWVPKDGEVVVPAAVEMCTSPLMEGSGRVQGGGSCASKRLVVVRESKTAEEKVNSPNSVQDVWVSEQSTPSSSSLLGYANH